MMVAILSFAEDESLRKALTFCLDKKPSYLEAVERSCDVVLE